MLDKILEFLLNLIEQILPCYVIHAYEEAVFYRFGKVYSTKGPGLHWKIPFLDSYSKDTVTTDTMRIQDVNITTLDGKTATIGGEFDLVISDITKAINDTHDWRSNLQDISRGVLSDSLEDINWEDIRKKTTKNSIEKKIAKRALDMGITTTNFSFTDKVLSRSIKLFGVEEKIKSN